jgi:hypothetical protein
MFTTRMKMLAAALFGVAILSTALTSAPTPAFALGECGPNAHRGPWGGCRFGGQNQAWCLRNSGHVAASCRFSAVAPGKVQGGRMMM